MGNFFNDAMQKLLENAVIEYKKIVDIKADLFSFILRKEPLNDSLYNLEIKFTSIIYLPKK